MDVLLLPLLIVPFAVGSPLEHISIKDDENRIVGGQEAEPHSIPYQVGLQIHTSRSKLWCGGSLISESFVLTAAHCVENAKKVEVFLGAHDILKDEASRVEIEVTKANIQVHSGWNAQTVQNDIALIKFPEKVALNDVIQPINLPRKIQMTETFAGKIGKASGWGLTSDSGQGVTPRLRYVDIPIIGRSECVRYFGNGIRDQHICISGSGRKGACNGDSGGPLAVTESNTTIIVGIASFRGPLGCEAGWPTVYTRVTYHLEWLSSRTGIEIE